MDSLIKAMVDTSRAYRKVLEEPLQDQVFDVKLAAQALADVGDRLRKAAVSLYPGVPWSQWTPEMWDKIYEVAEREWVDDQR